ncbi:unnamed protein product [Dicrocoelium dendriticum]|nr:unnamed protein product [Dicrocoelium dendriticum]
MRFIVYEQTELVPGTVTYEQWVQPTIDIYFQAYLFNLTNPIEFQAGEKPILRQLGPYTYKERRFKKDILPQAMPSTLQYKEVKEYYFKPAMSAGSESDVVTTGVIQSLETCYPKQRHGTNVILGVEISTFSSTTEVQLMTSRTANLTARADPSYRDGVIGLNPTEEMNTSFSIEPNTGAVFHVSKQLQINAVVRNDSKFPELAQVRNVILPLMYMNETFHIDEKTAVRIRSSLIRGPFWSKVILGVVAATLIVASIFAWIYWFCRQRQLTLPGVNYASLTNEPEQETSESVVQKSP